MLSKYIQKISFFSFVFMKIVYFLSKKCSKMFVNLATGIMHHIFHKRKALFVIVHEIALFILTKD